MGNNYKNHFFPVKFPIFEFISKPIDNLREPLVALLTSLAVFGDQFRLSLIVKEGIVPVLVAIKNLIFYLLVLPYLVVPNLEPPVLINPLVHLIEILLYCGLNKNGPIVNC